MALVEEAPAAVRDLQARGVVFDLDHEGRLALGLEGGHSARRIVHSGGSQTGREITSKLAAMVANDERIEVRENTSATALWSDGERCFGVITDAGALGSRRDGDGDRRRRGALAADDQPARGDRRRPGLRRGGGRRPRRPRVLPVPPDRARPPDTRFDGR